MYHPLDVRQDREYRYRVHELGNGKWQVERADMTGHYASLLNHATLDWQYFLTVDTKKEADEIVAKAQQKPKYHYY